MLSFSRSAVLAATILSFAALPLVAATSAGPGGGMPSPIGQKTSIAFGPGGGMPSPIGQKADLEFGPGGGMPSPIGQVIG